MRNPKLRWLLGLATVALLTAGGFGVSALWPDRITQANYNRIGKGMSTADVRAILGPTNLTQSDVDRQFEVPWIHSEGIYTAFDANSGYTETWDYWGGRSGVVMVVFDGERVRAKQWVPRRNLLQHVQRLWQTWCDEPKQTGYARPAEPPF